MGVRSEQKENRRQQILSCSLDLFVHKGYHGTTVRDIAKNSSIGVGLLFHYFPTKQAILEELLSMAQSGIESSLELMTQTATAIICFEQITNQIFQAFRDSSTAASIFMLSNQALTSDWVSEDVKKLISSSTSVEQTAQLIQQGQQEGSIRKGDPLSLSLAFWGAIQGVAEGLVCYPDIPVPEAEWIIDILRN
jgi:AcrR family transcriptional regulator